MNRGARNRSGWAAPLARPAGRRRKNPGRPSARALRRLFRKRAKQAGLPEFAPHDLRRTFVSELLDAGVDLNVARALAGHASVTTTAGYDRRPEAAKRKGAQAQAAPFQARRA